MPGSGRPAATGRGSWPLVGRSAELDRFREVLLAGDVCAVTLHGPAGVGKTRLADEFLSAVTDLGRAAARAGATPTSTAVPLGALAPLLPPGTNAGAFDPVALYAAVADDLKERAGDAPFVLLIDDLPLLDPTSHFLVGQLLDAGVIFLIATVRTDDPLHDSVTTLWRREDVLRLDLGRLSLDDVTRLLHLALGGPVEPATANAIWETSAGNALFVRELVLGAQRAGNLVERNGVWALAGPLLSTARLNEVVDARIGALPGAGRLVVDTLAMWEPVGLGELEQVAGADALEAVDRAKLIEVRLDGRRQSVQLGHPLFGEALRDGLPPLRRRRLLLDGADRIEAFGARRREDVVRVATARMEGSGSADPQLLVAAARVARYGHDFQSVERLARASLAEQDTPAAVLLLGEALHELGSYEEAEVVLSKAAGAAAGADEPLRMQLQAMRVRNLVFGLQRLTEAATVNREAQRQNWSAAARNELITDEATTLLYSDRPLEALEALERLPPDADDRAQVLAATAAAPALVSVGRCEEALELAARTYRKHVALGDQLAIANPGVHLVFRMYALTEAGRLGEADELALAGFEASGGKGPPIGRLWWAQGLGRSALLAGRPVTAQRWLTEADRICAEQGFGGPRRLVLSLLAVSAAWLGDADRADAAVDQLDTLPPWRYLAGQQEIGRAWAQVAHGRPREARELLLSEARAASEAGLRTTEALMLHDVVRLGDAAAAAGRLQELARQCEGALMAAYAAHARAEAEGDPDLLDDASRRFEHTGAILCAAEAATAAAHAHQRAHAQKLAAASLARAARLSAQCEGARTPALITTSAIVPLTRREREIGMLAASGSSSRQIAEQLYVSIRTVDNHLQSIYAKLGISSRTELADALGSTSAPSR